MPEVALEYVTCDLCGSDNHETLFSKVDPATGVECTVVRCSCGMGMVNPAPTSESLAFFYPPQYHEGKELQAAMYERMFDLLPRPARGRLLDVGCARGDFIAHASARGWHVHGVDVFDWGSPYQVPISIGEFPTMELPEAGFDVVTAWALLEHVKHPSRYIEHIARLLKPGGQFIFVVPNLSAPGMKYSCAEDVPRHLWLFSPGTVRAYAGNNGLSVVSILHDGAIYKNYPFGLLRRWILNLTGTETRCSRYGNRSVALLMNRQLRGNLTWWLKEVLAHLPPHVICIDMVDLAMGIGLSTWGRLIGNYPVITVIAEKG